MSVTGRDSAPATAASDLAASLREAAFVRLVSGASGASLAATGVLARALDDDGTPFQASVVGPFADPDRTTDADCVVALGHTGPNADVTVTDRVAATAFETARELDATTSPTLALAGTLAAGQVDGTVAEAAERAGLERRPGVAVPLADLADGLAHTTLLSGPFSGDEERARAALADLDLPASPSDDDHRRVASLVALAVTGAETASDRAATAIQRALRPYAGGPFETVGGYADVLDAAARTRPGTAIALALGHDSVREDALAAWRRHASRAHEAVREATTGRYEGLFVARGDAMPVGTVARLVADFRSPEPVTLVVTDGEAAVRATDGRDVTAPLRAATDAVGGRTVATDAGARAQFDVSTADLIEAFREAL
ncbi:hypothetical protein ACFQGE_13835 [Halomicroarcula sp. GCM10025817]|uniref:hypothetical protein n=1 Tax=Haloarcula TaxID=2237 RepID=UPI0023E82206|nr:hypothetical protein [Halomicroarcula sp. SYNS111]